MNKPSKKLNIAYTIPIGYGLELNVKNSANAWWMAKDKVYRLIGAFRYLATIPEACQESNITPKQYKYFARLHPEIKEIKDKLRLIPNMKAKITLIKAIQDGDLKIARWWLSKKSPEEFPSSLSTRDQNYLKLQQKIRAIQNSEKNPEVDILMNEFNERLREILTQKPTTK